MDGDTIAILGGFIVLIVMLTGIPIYLSVKRAKFRREAAYALSANAIVIGKRTHIGYEARYTNFFVTFEIEGVGRVEFNVAGSVSGLLVEGDRGTLRYLTDPLRFVDFSLTQRSQFQQ